MKNLLKFETQTAFETAKGGGNIDTPCVSLITENNEIIMTTKKINENDLPGPYVEIAGISWASCNLGATKPCEYGDYYMWGSTTPNNNDNCVWANTPFNNGSSKYDESYFNSVKDTVCPNGVLAPEYDAIRVATEGFARIPTNAEFQSLKDNTTQEVCDCTYMGGDHIQHSSMGLLFTSKTDTSKKIFIPFSGCRYGETVSDTGDTAYLWSSSLYSVAQDAFNLYCDINGVVDPDYSDSYFGFALRGVKN